MENPPASPLHTSQGSVLHPRLTKLLQAPDPTETLSCQAQVLHSCPICQPLTLANPRAALQPGHPTTPSHPNQSLLLSLPRVASGSLPQPPLQSQSPQAILNTRRKTGTVHGRSLSLLEPVTVFLQRLDAVPDLAPHFPQLEEREVPLGLLNWKQRVVREYLSSREPHPGPQHR